MHFNIGDKVWIPCEVKPGPFSNERLARIQLSHFDEAPWLGFVDVASLKEQVETGNTHVVAVVVDLNQPTHVGVIIQGHAFDVGQIRASREEVQLVSVTP